jgi:hypothetical protein
VPVGVADRGHEEHELRLVIVELKQGLEHPEHGFYDRGTGI